MIGQGRAGIRMKVRTVTPSLPKQTLGPATVEKSMPEVATQPQVTAQTEHLSPNQTAFKQPLSPRIVTRQVPFYPDPLLRPPPRLPDLKENRRNLSDLDMDKNTDFEENSPYQEGIISETYERLDKAYIKEPPELRDLLDITKIVQHFLPKQTDIDKILGVIQRKVHICQLQLKKSKAGYLTSPYFRDLYLYLSQNKLPHKRSTIHKVEVLVEKFILLDFLLFKLVTTLYRKTVLLAIPEICADKIITLYQSSLFCRTSGSNKNIPHNRR